MNTRLDIDRARCEGRGAGTELLGELLDTGPWSAHAHGPGRYRSSRRR